MQSPLPPVVAPAATGSGERPTHPRDGDATRALLVETAERLFAEQGIGPVSVRAINREAGLAAAAVHYHFGSKQGILDAVLRRLGEPIQERFIAGAQVLLARRRAPTSRDVIEMWANPIIECLHADPVRTARWLQLTTRLSGRESARLWSDLGESWTAVMSRAFPDVSDKQRYRGWAMAVQTLPHLLARAPGHGSDEDRRPRKKYIAGCVDFVVFGLDGFMRSGAEPARGDNGGRPGPTANDRGASGSS